MTNEETDQLFHALSHQIRRHILDLLRAEPGLAVGELAKSFDVSRIAVMNHLAVLEKANLVISQKEGRSRRLYINIMPIHEIYERWADNYSSIWSNRLSDIKTLAERAAAAQRKEND